MQKTDLFDLLKAKPSVDPEKANDPLSPEIIKKKINDHFEGKRKNYHSDVNRASAIGHQCMRYLVYKRTVYEKETLASVGLMKIFEEGNIQERAVVDLLQQIGYEVIKQQQDFFDRDANIKGHIDGRLKPFHSDKSKLCEIKSMSPFVFDSVHSIGDLKKKSWTARYIDQLLFYMYADEEKSALFILKNKSTGEIKVLELFMDHINQQRVENLLLKAKTINKHIEEKTLPEKLNVGEICQRCGFKEHCMPVMEYEALVPVDDTHLEEMLVRRDQIEEPGKEYKKIDEGIKHLLKQRAGDKFLIGSFFIQRKDGERTGWLPIEEIPEDIKRKYQKKSQTISYKIEKI